MFPVPLAPDLLPSRLQSKNVKVVPETVVILPALLFGYKTWFRTLKNGQRPEDVDENIWDEIEKTA
jgi:hypothetical protein